MKNIYLIPLLSLLVIACNMPTVNIESDIKPTLRSNWDAFIIAWEQEDAATCASLYIEDGINIPPELEANKGKEKIRKFYQFLFDNNLKSDYDHNIISIAGDNKNIIERGQFSVNWTRNDSTTWTYHARTMTHWVNIKGDWKIQSFLFNNPPAD